MKRIHKMERAYTAFGYCDEGVPDRSGVYPPLHGKTFTASPVLSGCHCFHRNKQVMQAGGSGESGIERRLENGTRLAEEAFRIPQGSYLEEILWRHAGPLTEHAMAMKLCLAQDAAQRPPKMVARGH